MMLKLKLTFILIFCLNISKANVVKDSAAIVSVFLQVLQNPSKFDSISEKAKQIYEKNASNLLIKDTYLFNLAKTLFQTAQLDSALIVAKEGQAIYKDNPLNYKNAKFHNVIASVYAYKKDYETSIIEFNKAIEIFDKNNDPYQVALIKNNIANIFFSLSDYENAYKYSKESQAYLKSVNDTVYLPSLTAVTALSAIELNKLDEGNKLVEECLSLSERYGSVIGLIIGHYAKGEYLLAKNDLKNGIEEFDRSLAMSKKYGLKQYGLLNKTGLLIAYNKIKDYTSAVKYGEDALKDAKLLQNENMLYSLHKHLGRAYAGSGDYKKAFENINTAHEIYRETSNAETQKSINDLLIKYETEKKEKELIQKDLQLAKDEVKLNKRKQWIVGLAALIVLLMLVYVLYSKYQKQKLFQLEKEQETKLLLALITGEEEERKRLSNELHDGLASSISGIKIQLEHLSALNQNTEINKLVKQLSNLHEETRRISHNLMPASLTLHSFSEALKQYCSENSSTKLTINFFDAIKGNINLNDKVKNVVYRIVQELVNNVQKHSKSKVCFVQLSQNDSHLTVSIEDEGIGFDSNQKNNTQGLKSITQRIESLGGSISIDSQIAKGTLVVIQIPLSKT
jgi:signal transduction histidine kinase